MSRLRPYHSLSVAAFLFGPIGFLLPLGLAPLLALSSLLAVVLKRREENQWPQLPKDQVIFFGIFVALGLVSSFWAVVPAQSLKQAFSLAMVFLAGLILFDVGRSLTNWEKAALGKVFFKGFLLAIVLITIEYFFDGVIGKALRNQQYSQPFYVYIRSASVVALLPWPLLLVLNKTWPLNSRWLVFLAAAVCTYWLDNNTALAALVLGGVCYLLVRLFSYKYLKFLGYLVVVAVMIAPALPLTVLNHDTLVQYLSPNDEKAFYSLKHRFTIWKFTANKIIEKPIAGWGLNSSRSIPGGNGSVDTFSHGELLPLHPHNGVLQVWLELGILGALFLAGFFAFVLTAIKNAPFPKEEKGILIGGFVAALVIFCSSYGVWQSWWMSALIFTGLFLRTLATKE